MNKFLRYSLLTLLVAVFSGAWAADKWVLTDPANLATGDVVVIVDKTSAMAMANDKGTGSAPTATTVSLNTDKSEITGTVAENLQWTVTVADGSYQFAVGEDYLYVTKTNNGVRVGSGERNSFTIVTGGDNGGYYLYNEGSDGDKRWVGCYNTSDWRCYTSINSNIKVNNNAFYKKVSSDKIPVVTVNSLTPTQVNINTAVEMFSLDLTRAAEGVQYTIKYASSDPDMLTVYNGDHLGEYSVGSTTGTVTITVTITPADTETYETVTYTQEVTIVDPSIASVTYEKVTNVSQLVAGNEYILVAPGYNKAMGAQGNNIRSCVDVTIADNKVSITDEAVAVMTLGGSTGAWTFNTTDGYLSYSGSSNQVYVASETSEATNWVVTDDFMLESANVSGRVLKYNSGSPRFACYSSGQQAAVLFVKEGSAVGKTPVASSCTITPTELAVGATGSFNADVAANFNGLDMTDWTSDNEEVLSVNGSYYVAHKVGTATVTFNCKPLENVEGWEQYEAVAFTQTITVYDPNGPGTSAENPYTVEQARAAIDAGTGVTGVYAKGIVSEIVTAYNSQYGNITYNISADGTTSAVQLQAYRGKSYNGDNFTSEDDIQVGDEVVIFGNLTKYNQIYEFAQDNQLVSLVRKPSVAEITTDLTELEMGTPIRWEDFTITYAEGVDEDDVEVDYDVEGFQMDLDQGLLPEGAETASITFTFTYVGEGNYSDVEKTFTFNVVDNRPDPAFAFTPNTMTIVKGEDFEQPEFSCADENLISVMSYVSDNSNVADWNPEDGLVLGGELGTANIVVWYNSPIYDTDWKSSNALLTVTVVDELPTGVTYRKVTSTDELTDGKYLIVYEDGNVAFDGSLTELDASGNHQEVTITDDEIVTDAAIYFTLDVTAGTIQSASGYYIGITGGSNGLGQSVDAEAYTNTFSFNEGKAVIVSGNNMTLSYNSDSNQKRFRYFKNGGQKPIALYKEVLPETVDVTISESTYATFYYESKAFEIPEGITASAVVRDGSSLSEIPVENVIPAGCPVLLHGAAGEYEFVETTEEGVMPTANSLIGSEEGGTYNEAGYKYYVLSWKDKNKNPEEVGFYFLSGSKGAYAKVKAHQAYMRVTSTQANEAGYVIGETTGITSIAADGTDSTAPMYNLAGQRVNDSFRGVVIQNGKKTIKK